MHISHLVIKNFRALEDIQFDLVPRINVIVGPNAVGKSTILQAIRLAKALTAPRAANEAQQALVSLGAGSPHFPQRIFTRRLAARESIADIPQAKWVADFVAHCETERKALEVAWEATWKERCNGKRLFEDFIRTGALRVSLATFKRRILQQMKSSGSESWRLVSSLLRDLLKS